MYGMSQEQNLAGKFATDATSGIQRTDKQSIFEKGARRFRKLRKQPSFQV